MSCYSFLKTYKIPRVNLLPTLDSSRDMPGKKKRESESDEGEASDSTEHSSDSRDEDSSESSSSSSSDSEPEDEAPPSRDDHGPPNDEEALAKFFEKNKRVDAKEVTCVLSKGSLRLYFHTMVSDGRLDCEGKKALASK